MNKIKLLTTLAVSSLVLAGCGNAQPSIYELAYPANVCQGEEVYLEVTNNQPRYNSTTQTTFTLSVVDSRGTLVSNDVLETLEIHYRMGIFEETGFQQVSTDGFSARSPYNPSPSPTPEVPREPLPLPSRDSFLDMFWDTQGPEPTEEPSDGNVVVSVPMESASKTGDLAQLLEFDSEDELISQFETVAMFPGAFLASCLDPVEELDISEVNYVAAVSLYPNSSVDNVMPDAYMSVDGSDNDVVVFDFGDVFGNPSDFGVIFAFVAPVSNERFSQHPINDRWLHLFSYGQSELDSTRGFVVYEESGGSAPDASTVFEVMPLPNGNYIATFNYTLISTEYSDLRTGTAYYDLNVSGSNYTFTPWNFQLPSNSVAKPLPTVDLVSQSLLVKTKGFRKLSLSGRNLNSVTEVIVGGKKAKVTNTSSGRIDFLAPAFSAGKYAVDLRTKASTIKSVATINYSPSKKIADLQRNALDKKATWLRSAKVSLAKHPSTTQVDCVVSLPSGQSNRALRNKAEAICKNIRSSNPEVKTAVRTVISNKTRAASLTLRFWG